MLPLRQAQGALGRDRSMGAFPAALRGPKYLWPRGCTGPGSLILALTEHPQRAGLLERTFQCLLTSGYSFKLFKGLNSSNLHKEPHDVGTVIIPFYEGGN